MNQMKTLTNEELNGINGGDGLLSDITWLSGYIIGAGSTAYERIIKLHDGKLPMYMNPAKPYY
ncbi:MAG: bacteriocin [Clostridium perfringens]|nr:bacteriocin [Clostridium perfringens]MDM0701874.1 bacteriocin [Clostridium perfringens]MDU7158697.1 bacteriocin [Clostridium perfringens]